MSECISSKVQNNQIKISDHKKLTTIVCVFSVKLRKNAFDRNERLWIEVVMTFQ